MAETREFAALKQREQVDSRTRLIRQVILLLFMLLVVLLLLLPVLVETGLSGRRSQPMIDRVANAVSDVSGVRGVVDAELVTTPDHILPQLRVVYLTSETDVIGYRAEIVEVYRAIGEVLVGTDTQVAQVVLVPSVQVDEAIEIISAPMQKVRALQADDITRTEFLDELDVETVRGVGAHTDPAPDV